MRYQLIRRTKRGACIIECFDVTPAEARERIERMWQGRNECRLYWADTPKGESEDMRLADAVENEIGGRGFWWFFDPSQVPKDEVRQ